MVVELEPVLVSFGRFYDIFVIFFNYATFGDATYFAIFSWRCDFFAIFFGGATFLSSLILYGDFCLLFEATTFCHFRGISYFRGEEKFWARVCKILRLKRLVLVGVKMGKFKQRIDAQQIIEF